MSLIQWKQLNTDVEGANLTGSLSLSGSLEVTGSITGILLSTVLEITASSILSFDQSSKYLLANSGSAMTLTVPPSIDVPFFIGTSITVEQNGAGVVTFQTGSGVTINTSTGYKTNGQYTVTSLHKVNTDTWTLIGGVS